jgi:hypothetical protein
MPESDTISRTNASCLSARASPAASASRPGCRDSTLAPPSRRRPDARRPSALLMMSQSPFDPARGAARSMQTLARWLARGGWSVCAASTNATEAAHLAGGLARDAIVSASGALHATRWGAAWRASGSGVDWRWVETRHPPGRSGEAADYTRLLSSTLAQRQPDLVLCCGDEPGDRLRRAQCRRAGARVVLVLHDLAHLGRSLPDVDAYLCPSRFLQRAYRDAGLRAVDWLPLPVEGHDLRGPSSKDALVTLFVNPEPAKGLDLVAAMAARLARRRPGIPLMVVSGRSPTHQFCAALAQQGADLAAMPNLMLAPQGLLPAELFSLARVVLMPSLVPEGGGRVAVEGQCVGAVPLVSDRGALPEVVGAGGIVLPPGVAHLDAWQQALERLYDDEDHWQAMSRAARVNSQRHQAAAGVPALSAWARRVCQGAPALA